MQHKAQTRSMIASQRGITLIEVLIAVAIFSFVIAASAQSMISIMVGTQIQKDRVTATHSCRVVLNAIREKKLSNVRAAGKDDALILTPPMRMTLERAMSYIQDDELVEITPKSIRLRKRWLDPHVRKKMERKSEAEVA